MFPIKFYPNRNLLFVLLLVLSSSVLASNHKIYAQPKVDDPLPMNGQQMKDKMDMNMDEVKGKMDMDGIEHSEDHQHEHKMLDVSEVTNRPEVKISIGPDRMKGWNLQIDTTNFAFTPENLNQDSNPNEGHAHIYINGKKAGRIYGEWYYLPDLPKGEVEIKVTLNSNKHEDLMYQGEIVADTLTVFNNK